MAVAVVLLPLLGGLIAGILAFATPANHDARHTVDRLAQYVTCAAMIVAALLAVAVFYDVAVRGNVGTDDLFRWIESGTFEVSWAVKMDTLSALMIMVVSVVSSAIHVYSIGYMHYDPSIPRFMSYLSLFTFCMLALVTSDNLVQLFFGWEGVGLMSYLLIGFWYEKPSANAAAIKAFLVNRVGDFGFALGIFATYLMFDSVDFDAIFQAVPGKADATMRIFGGEFHAITVVCLLLFVGAMGKSAQIGLHTWLPDAMEGPTPVSALIHAATMVTAGVFMVARLSPVFEYSDVALTVVTIVGATTALFAASVGCVQNDIKRVIAYSTCSQLGYMFFACGVSAYSAGVFHLMTHAFFKALLFLGAGSVIHALSDEQDLRKMGGLWRLIPVTYVVMWIGSLAGAGIWPFAGYYSKDIILEAAFASGTTVGQFAFWVGAATACLTAFYTFRLLILTFHGAPHADEAVMARVHESPAIMLWPLIFLAIGAVTAGFVGYSAFDGEGADRFWGEAILIFDSHPALEHAHHVAPWVKFLPLSLSGLGIAIAVLLYAIRPTLPDAIARTFPGLHKFLLNKWYFDELYDMLFVRPSFALARNLWKTGDEAIIDGFGPNGLASGTLNLASRAGALQSGFLYHYAFAMLAGVVILVSWYLFSRLG